MDRPTHFSSSLIIFILQTSPYHEYDENQEINKSKYIYKERTARHHGWGPMFVFSLGGGIGGFLALAAGDRLTTQVAATVGGESKMRLIRSATQSVWVKPLAYMCTKCGKLETWIGEHVGSGYAPIG